MTQELSSDEQVSVATQVLSRELKNWSLRSPTLVVAALQHLPLGAVFKVVTQAQNSEQEEFLVQTLANLMLSRYATVGRSLEQLETELQELVQNPDPRLLWLVKVLEKIRSIVHTLQRPATGPLTPHHLNYAAIAQVATRMLDTLNLRKLAEALEVAPLSIQELADAGLLPGTDEPPEAFTRSMALPTSPLEEPVPEKDPQHWQAVELLPMPQLRAYLVDFKTIPQAKEQREALLYWLPRLYGMLENWQTGHSEMELARLLTTLEPEVMLRYSAYVLPHKNQVSYLRCLAHILHLSYFMEWPLTQLEQQLNALLEIQEKPVQAILGFVFSQVYSCCTTFYAIQEQALKRLEFQRTYLYHLVTQEWTKNRAIHRYLKDTLNPTWVEHSSPLRPEDWRFIFELLHHGLARSVIRDVYGVFHGSSAFADHIVSPDISKGFGNSPQTVKGLTFLSTPAIANLLASHSQIELEAEDRALQFEQFVEERFRKVVLRNDDHRPILNVSTLKRIELFVAQIYQRGQEDHLNFENMAFHITRECLGGFSHLAAEQFSWLLYDLSHELLLKHQAAGAKEDDALKGIIHATLLLLIEDIYPNRPLEAEKIFFCCWQGLLFSSQDTAYLDWGSFKKVRELQNSLHEQTKRFTDRVMEARRNRYFSGFVELAMPPL